MHFLSIFFLVSLLDVRASALMVPTVPLWLRWPISCTLLGMLSWKGSAPVASVVNVPTTLCSAPMEDVSMPGSVGLDAPPTKNARNSCGEVVARRRNMHHRSFVSSPPSMNSQHFANWP